MTIKQIPSTEIKIYTANTKKELLYSFLDKKYIYEQYNEKLKNYNFHFFLKSTQSKGNKSYDLLYNDLLNYLSEYCELTDDDSNHLLDNSVEYLRERCYDNYKKEYDNMYLFSFELKKNVKFTEEDLNKISLVINKIGHKYNQYHTKYSIVSLHILNNKLVK